MEFIVWLTVERAGVTQHEELLYRGIVENLNLAEPSGPAEHMFVPEMSRLVEEWAPNFRALEFAPVPSVLRPQLR